jgi:hypothetical protein
VVSRVLLALVFALLGQSDDTVSCLGLISKDLERFTWSLARIATDRISVVELPHECFQPVFSRAKIMFRRRHNAGLVPGPKSHFSFRFGKDPAQRIFSASQCCFLIHSTSKHNVTSTFRTPMSPCPCRRVRVQTLILLCTKSLANCGGDLTGSGRSCRTSSTTLHVYRNDFCLGTAI